jgi:Fe2+ or Zn2+ uptake regulation protein
MTGHDDELAAILRKIGQKVTPQRLALLSALRRAEGHLTASQLLSASRSAHRSLDQSTVYRTLVAAEQAGLVARFVKGTEEAEFEWVRENHHHLLCDVCGGLSTLQESALAGLAKGIYDSAGFLVNVHHLAVRGICSDCQQRQLLADADVTST